MDLFLVLAVIWKLRFFSSRWWKKLFAWCRCSRSCSSLLSSTSSRVGKNRVYPVSVRGFKSQCGQVYLDRRYTKCSVGWTHMHCCHHLPISVFLFFSFLTSVWLSARTRTGDISWGIGHIRKKKKMLMTRSR